jgi:hypothetical protein
LRDKSEKALAQVDVQRMVEQEASGEELTRQLQKKHIETGRGYLAALPGSCRTLRRVFSQSLAAAPI